MPAWTSPSRRGGIATARGGADCPFSRRGIRNSPEAVNTFVSAVLEGHIASGRLDREAAVEDNWRVYKDGILDALRRVVPATRPRPRSWKRWYNAETAALREKPYSALADLEWRRHDGARRHDGPAGRVSTLREGTTTERASREERVVR